MDRHLALCVRTEIGHHLAFLADVGQRSHNEMGQVERHRHIVLCLIGGIAKHHALVASSLVIIVLAVHAAVDIGTLLVDGSQDAT